MKILITRTAPFHIFERAINKIMEEFPDSDITVMVQSSFKYQIEKYRQELKAVVMPDGKFRFSKRIFTIIKDIRKDRFDILVLLYNNSPGRGYFNLDVFSLLTGINKIMIYDLNDNFYQVNSRVKRVIKKSLVCGAGGVNYIFIKTLTNIWHLCKQVRYKCQQENLLSDTDTKH
ncbi:MAG: hypothetical protein HZA00_11540 [Nitrospinae bacterium]|nr:hypothetical protein [Nitrospinota bacterium]